MLKFHPEIPHQDLSKSYETQGSPGSQLVGHTPTQKKTPTSKRTRQLNDDLPATDEVTLDVVHNNLTKMIGKVGKY